MGKMKEWLMDMEDVPQFFLDYAEASSSDKSLDELP